MLNSWPWVNGWETSSEAWYSGIMIAGRGRKGRTWPWRLYAGLLWAPPSLEAGRLLVVSPANCQTHRSGDDQVTPALPPSTTGQLGREVVYPTRLRSIVNWEIALPEKERQDANRLAVARRRKVILCRFISQCICANAKNARASPVFHGMRCGHLESFQMLPDAPLKRDLEIPHTDDGLTLNPYEKQI